MPTGDANCPTVVREAKDIMREITLKCELEVFASDDEDTPNPPNPEENNAPPINAVPPVPTNVATGSNQGGSGSSVSRQSDVNTFPTNVATTINQEESDSSVSKQSDVNTSPMVRGNLRRFASTRKKKNEEEMSVSEFFKYSMMLREQDRKEREERDEKEKINNERNDRFFREMLMTVVLGGKNIQKDANVEGQE